MLAALPLGGYVRMASRHDAEAAFLEGGSEEGSRAQAGRRRVRSERDDAVRAEAGSRESRGSRRKRLWARLFIMIAGVVMNVVLAFVVVRRARTCTTASQSFRRDVIGAVHAVPGAPTLGQLQTRRYDPRGQRRRRSGTGTTSPSASPRRAATRSRSRRSAARCASRSARAGRQRRPTSPQCARLLSFRRSSTMCCRAAPRRRPGCSAGDCIVTIGGEPIVRWSRPGRARGRSRRAGPVTFDVIRRGQATVARRCARESTSGTDPVTKADAIRRADRSGGARPSRRGSRCRSVARCRPACGRPGATAAQIVDVVHGLITGERLRRSSSAARSRSRARRSAAAQSGLESCSC